jgi:L-serine dehydratase
LRTTRSLTPRNLPTLVFDPASDIVFDYGPPLPGHANGMIVSAYGAAGDVVVSETYYSIGGGFVVTAEDRENSRNAKSDSLKADQPPFPFASAAEMLRMARESGRSISEMKRVNECAARPEHAVDSGIERIWSAMNACIERGLSRDGELPGGLRVRRRAKRIRDQLERERGSNAAQPHVVSDWLSVYAMAVNEENAAGGKVVTAPTNGAAGVVPAVLRYYLDHCLGATRQDPGFPADSCSHRRPHQTQCLHIGSRGRLPGRSWFGRGHGGGRPLRGAGRNPRAGGKRR